MKIKLLNDGGFLGLQNVDFPAIVYGKFCEGCYLIKTSELYRVGADDGSFYSPYPEKEWAFVAGSHAVEVIHES